MSQFRIGDIERRLHNLIRPGTVLEADYQKARVRVKMGSNTSAWLPWVTQRAGGDRIWHPPEIGEQVLVIAPSGELAAGFVLSGGIYKQDHPANGDRATISRTTYADGAVVEYDRENHAYLMNVPQGGTITVKTGTASLEVNQQGITHRAGTTRVNITGSAVAVMCGNTSLHIGPDGVTITGPITIIGSVNQSAGSLNSNGIILQSHIHGGVTAGTAMSGPPMPILI